MQLFLSIICVCSVIGMINAASLTSGPVTKPHSQIADFEGLNNGNPALGLAVSTPYKYLNFSTFVYGTPSKYAIKPSSGTALAIAPYLLKNPGGQAEITIQYTNSEVTSFDMKSISHGCSLSSNNGLVVPAKKCTIRYTGIKANSDPQVTHQVVFKPDGFVDIGDILVGSVDLQETMFPSNFDGLKSLKIDLLEPTPATLYQMGFDDAKYTAWVRE